VYKYWNSMQRGYVLQILAAGTYSPRNSVWSCDMWLLQIFTYQCLEGRAMAQAVTQWPLTVEAQVQSQAVHVGFVLDKVPLEQIFLLWLLWFSPVGIFALMLCTH
jgi:hypothetical protein